MPIQPVLFRSTNQEPIHQKSANPLPITLTSIIYQWPTHQTRICMQFLQKNTNPETACQSTTNPAFHHIHIVANPLSIKKKSASITKCHLDTSPISKTGLAAHRHRSNQSFTNPRTIAQVTRELVLYVDRLLVSTEDDFFRRQQSYATPPSSTNPCQSCTNPFPI